MRSASVRPSIGRAAGALLAVMLLGADRTSTGIITTVAGTGVSGYNGDSGVATSTELGNPYGIAVDLQGNLFIADANDQRIWKVSDVGTITTIAGNGNRGFAGDGAPATSAQLDHPHDVAVDSTGNIYIADMYNDRIRKVSTAGIISTVAGNGSRGSTGDGGPAISASIGRVVSVTADSAGNFYFIEYIGNLTHRDLTDCRIRKVSASGIISTVAGNGGNGFGGDGGAAIEASLSTPVGIACDSKENIYIADTGNDRIRKVSASGIITTVAGGGMNDADGVSATSAILSSPIGVAVDAAGNLFFADMNSQRIRQVSASGIISTVAGNGSFGFNGDGIPAGAASLASPQGVAIDAFGGVYLTDHENYRIRKVK